MHMAQTMLTTVTRSVSDVTRDELECGFLHATVQDRMRGARDRSLLLREVFPSGFNAIKHRGNQGMGNFSNNLLHKLENERGKVEQRSFKHALVIPRPSFVSVFRGNEQESYTALVRERDRDIVEPGSPQFVFRDEPNGAMSFSVIDMSLECLERELQPKGLHSPVHRKRRREHLYGHLHSNVSDDGVWQEVFMSSSFRKQQASKQCVQFVRSYSQAHEHYSSALVVEVCRNVALADGFGLQPPPVVAMVDIPVGTSFAEASVMLKHAVSMDSDSDLSLVEFRYHHTQLRAWSTLEGEFDWFFASQLAQRYNDSKLQVLLSKRCKNIIRAEPKLGIDAIGRAVLLEHPVSVHSQDPSKVLIGSKNRIEFETERHNQIEHLVITQERLMCGNSPYSEVSDTTPRETYTRSTLDEFIPHLPQAKVDVDKSLAVPGLAAGSSASPLVHMSDALPKLQICNRKPISNDNCFSHKSYKTPVDAEKQRLLAESLVAQLVVQPSQLCQFDSVDVRRPCPAQMKLQKQASKGHLYGFLQQSLSAK